MIKKRIYDPEIEEVASIFPRLDISDIPTARATLETFIEDMAKQGVERPTDDRIEEIERMIPGPGGAPDVRIRIYMPKDRTEAGTRVCEFPWRRICIGRPGIRTSPLPHHGRPGWSSFHWR